MKAPSNATKIGFERTVNQTDFANRKISSIPFPLVYYFLMEYAVILANFMLIGAILRGKLWIRVPVLSILAALSTIETPLLYWGFAHLPRYNYFLLYYAIDLISITLTVLCTIQFFPTQLRLISISMLIFLGIESLEWIFLITKNHALRIQVAQLERPMNLLFIIVWTFMIYNYTNEERRHNERTYRTSSS